MTIISIYKEYFTKIYIKLDSAQENIMKEIYKMHELIVKYKKERSSSIKKLFSRPRVPKGMYLWGGVGRGKSMIMEAFFLKVPLIKKKKIHFHNFMTDVHSYLKNKRSDKDNKEDYLQEIARNLAEDYRLLFIDELQITDIADAMIVGKLFRELFNNNIMIVTTSNRKPDDLYHNGLQRESFLGFIELIKNNLEVIEIKSEKDYRMEKIHSMNSTYFIRNNKKLDEIFQELIGGDKFKEKILEVKKRKIVCKKTYKHIAYFSFKELCSEALGAEDYKKICDNFNVILLKDLPILKPEDRNEAKRFVTLIDTIYDNKVILIISAETEVNSIYKTGDGSFEFERTISRLIEMQSDSYRENYENNISKS